MDAGACAVEIEAIVLHHCPGKTANVQVLLERYSGHEAALLELFGRHFANGKRQPKSY